MQQTNNSPSRKKFLWWGAAALAAIAGSRFFSTRQKKNLSKENTATVKMLTREGHLVEIDKNLLASGSKKISTEELKQWVNKKSEQ